MISKPDLGDNIEEKVPLLSFAIIEKETDTQIVKTHLEKMNAYFLNRFSFYDIFSKKNKYFQSFSKRIDEVLGDLRLKTEDRFRSIF